MKLGILVLVVLVGALLYGYVMSRRAKRTGKSSRNITNFEKFQLPGQQGGTMGPSQLGSLGNLEGRLDDFELRRGTNDAVVEDPQPGQYPGD